MELILHCHTSKITLLSRLPWKSGEFSTAKTVWMKQWFWLYVKFQPPSPHMPVERSLCVMCVTVSRLDSCCCVSSSANFQVIKCGRQYVIYIYWNWKWITQVKSNITTQYKPLWWQTHFSSCLHSSTGLLAVLCYQWKYCEDCPVFCFCKDPKNRGSGTTYSSKYII